MIIGFCGFIEYRQNSINSLGERNGGINIAEENTRSFMNEVIANKAKLAFGKDGLRMRTGRRLKFPASHVSSNAENILSMLYSSPSMCSGLALPGFKGEDRMGIGEGVGSVTAVDMARGVGNGIGELSACGDLRVILMNTPVSCDL